MASPNATASVTTDHVFVLPATSNQRRLWFVEQAGVPDGSYTVPAAFLIDGALDTAALESALAAIVSRHESLRTAFRLRDGQLVQVISPELRVPLERRVFSGDEPALIAAMGAESARPFDLQQGPLLRACLWERSATSYGLLLAAHHIVVDGASMQILLREWGDVYAAARRGRAPSLPATGIQYGDYALWESEQLERPPSDGPDEDIGFWSRYLAGDLPILELPRRNDGADARQAGGFAHLRIGHDVTAGISAMARSEGASFFMIGLAAFMTVLYRYTGQEELLVGAPVANRLQPEVEQTVGFFANTVVVRGGLSANFTFLDLVRHIRRDALEVFARQHVPFDRIVNAARAQRRSPANPLFQVMFAAQRVAEAPLALGDAAVRQIFVETGGAKFDLLLELQERSDGIDSLLEYRRDVFDGPAAHRFLQHVVNVIDAGTRAPHTPIGRIDLLSPSERHELLETWNATTRLWPVPTEVDPQSVGVHHLFEAQVARTPDAVAVRDARGAWSYKQLNASAEALAVTLNERGVGPGSIVALALERSGRMVVAMLGVLKSGAAYLPLDPNLPEARRRFILDDAGVDLVLVDGPVEVGTIPMLSMSAIKGDDRVRPSTRPASSGEAPAYLIYTSGSTGQPKGVVVPHRAALNFVHTMLEAPGIRAADVILGLTTLSFDIAFLELMCPLAVGASVFVGDAAEVTDGRSLSQLVASQGITVVQATPATWRLLLDAQWKGSPSLRLITGGEALTPDLASALLTRCGELWNGYGPTETTVYSSVARITSADDISIGRPVANTGLYVLDAERQPVPIGVLGELYIGGHGLAVGYHKRPDLTSERFVPSPFAPGERLYRTGDSVRWRPDGQIEFRGRLDHQVKLRGFRIELGEIERRLELHPAVNAVAVVLREDTPGDPRLVAYVVPGDDTVQIDVAAIRENLRGWLPAYMVPSTFVTLDALPRTGSGKVDRRNLPRPIQTPRTNAHEMTAPRDDVERELHRLWQELMPGVTMGVHDSFFDLGGHSLLAARMFYEIERRFEKRLPLAVLFERSTIGGLAEVLRVPTVAPPAAKSRVDIRVSGRRTPIFAIHAGAGQVLFYRELAGLIGEDRPFYGLQAPAGLDGRTRPYGEFESIEALAALYVDEIRAARPRGPYLLCGACAGGAIALEVAQRLQQSGEHVEWLVLFDSWLVNTGDDLKGRANRHFLALQAMSIWARARYLIRGLWSTVHYHFVRSVKFVSEAPNAAWLRIAPRLYRLFGTRAPQHLLDARFLKTSVKMVSAYLPQPYSGNVVLVRSATYDHNATLPSEQVESMGWRGIATGPLDVIDMPGVHLDMLQPPIVTELALAVRDRIDRTEESR